MFVSFSSIAHLIVYLAVKISSLNELFPEKPLLLLFLKSLSCIFTPLSVSRLRLH